ncbi:MAG: flavodoxin [Actinomycetales bacterium]|nr:flavodoxin [Actinomycetales bacterium]
MRVLMVVGSRHGATQEIGDAVAEVLADAGHEVVGRDPDDFTSVAGFDAMVLGSAIYYGRWVPAVRELVERHAGSLAAIPLWVFWSGPLGSKGVPRGSVEGMDELLERLRPRGFREFDGRIDRGELGMRERAVVSLVGADYGDYRDFDEVRAWAHEIVEELGGTG